MFGREAECSALDAVLDRARRGESSATLISGEPGIGKTSLCDYAAAHAADFVVLRTRGIESEARVSFAGLSLLFSSLVPLFEHLPEPQRRALTGALALEQPSPVPPLALAYATLNVLATAAEDRPLLAIVDDAHWLDAPSLQAIAFAARRLGQESVALVFAQRPAEGTPLADGGLEVLGVSGLSVEAAKRLFERITDSPPPTRVTRGLVEATGGNPMALMQAVSSLPKDVLSGRAALPDPVVLEGGVATAHERRIAALPASTRRALVVLAADATGSLALIVSALAQQEVGLEAFEPAERADVVYVDGTTVTFVHPLLRAAAYRSATSAERRAAHRALAEAGMAAGDDERRAWHLAAAATGPDETVASLLERVASEAEMVGGAVAAAPPLARAAHLTPAGETRARRLVAAASALFLAGRTDEVEPLLDESLTHSQDVITRADNTRVRSQLLAAGGEVERAVSLIRREAQDVALLDVQKAAMMLCEMAVPSAWYGNGRDALTMAREANELGERAGGLAGLFAADYLAHVFLFSGEFERGRALLWQVHEHWEQRPGDTGLMIPGPAIGLLCLEAYAEAGAVARAGIDEARALGAPAALLFPLGALAEIDFCTGDWLSSYAGATEVVELAGAIGHKAQEGFGLVGQARIEAAQGREEECIAHLDRAAKTSATYGSDYLSVYIECARGLLDISLGRPASAYAHLEPLTEWLTSRGWAGMINKERYGGDLVEAAILMGERAEAERLLEIFEADSAKADHRWSRAATLRSHALLADDDQAEAYFSEALQVHATTTTAFETARTELQLGEFLRRRRRRADSIPHLWRASATFERLSATPWAKRAARELQAAGEAGAVVALNALQGLTTQEQQVALVVAEGSSNKNAAAALFISPRTVEFHLAKIYRKLGITSRSQLTRLVLTERGFDPDVVGAPSD